MTTDDRAFLVGAERSGTTMLRLMLSHHPRLTWLAETEYVVDFVPAPGSWPSVDEFLRNADLVRGFNEFARNMGLTFDRSLEYPLLVDSILGQIQDQDETSLIGATIHRHFDRLVSLWPRARYVHLVRDGRDVARSRIGMGWAGNVWTGAYDWVEKETQWEAVRSALPADHVYDVSYEPLVTEPERTLSGVCEFLGVDYDSEMLAYPEDSSYDAPDARLVCQWRLKLSDRDVRRVEAVQRDMLVKRGYELSGLPELAVGPIEAILLRLQCRAYRIKTRFFRQGPRLFFADSLSRRVGTASWRRSVVHRANENAKKYLK